MDLLKDSVPLDEAESLKNDSEKRELYTRLYHSDPIVRQAIDLHASLPCCSIAVGGYACTCGGKAQAPGDLEALVKQLGGRVIWDARHPRPRDPFEQCCDGKLEITEHTHDATHSTYFQVRHTDTCTVFGLKPQ